MDLIQKAFWFLLAIGILVPIHEWGHYSVARACGVKVLRFSIGFGRVLWSRVGRGGTEFAISALPLGGYVRMLGMGDETVVPHEREQAFKNRPVRQRAAILAAGPAANWLLAIVLFAVVAWIGSEQPKALLGTPPSASLAAWVAAAIRSDAGRIFADASTAAGAPSETGAPAAGLSAGTASGWNSGLSSTRPCTWPVTPRAVPSSSSPVASTTRSRSMRSSNRKSCSRLSPISTVRVSRSMRELSASMCRCW